MEMEIDTTTTTTTNNKTNMIEYKRPKFNAFYILWFYYIFPEQKEELIHIREPFSTALMYNLHLNISLELNDIFASQILLYSHHKAKFSIIQYVCKHLFISPAQIASFLNIFSAIQKIYSWLNRRVRLRKLKKIIVAVDTDLYYNNLSPSKPYVFPLHQLNNIFYFSISDIMNIIQCALCQNWEDNFVVKSRMPQNPYNKQFLKKHDLYNLYFHMKYKMNCVIPIYFHLWFLEEFDLRKYVDKHETMLRKMCIRQFTKNAQNTNKMVAEDILDMFDEYKYICMWEIDANFPTSVLVDNFRSYLYLYYLLNYNGLEPCMMDQYETILEVGLKKCYDHNPSFGRKLVSQENIIVFEWEKKICCKNKKLCSSATTSGDLFNTDAIPLSSWNY